MQRVKAEAAMYTAGFVLMTLIINGGLAAPLISVLKLNSISKEQLLMRGHVSRFCGVGVWCFRAVSGSRVDTGHQLSTLRVLMSPFINSHNHERACVHRQLAAAQLRVI